MKSKEQKRIEAEVRQDEYNSLTVSEKWERMKSRPGVSGRETNRLIDADPTGRIK